jgi:hypothetical protein
VLGLIPDIGSISLEAKLSIVFGIIGTVLAAIQVVAIFLVKRDIPDRT